MPKKQEKRSDGRYQVSVSLGRDPETGKRVQKYFYGESQKEAKKKRDEWTASQKESVARDATPMTVSSWADRWLEVYGQGSYSTKNIHKNVITKLKDAIGDIPLSDVRKSDIKLFANDMDEYSFSMVKKIKGATSRIFADAVADRLIDVNPCAGIAWEHAGKGTHRALEDWERNLFAQNWSVYRCGTWAMLMLFTGMRRGEALALQWKDVDFDAQIIHVTRALHFEGNEAVMSDTPKTLAGIRRIPILPPLLPVLQAKKGYPNDFICQSADGSPMTEAAFRKGWISLMNVMENILNGEPGIQLGRRSDIGKLDENGIVIHRRAFSCRTHDLRHTFCTMLYEADVDLKTAQYLMGHADAEMTLKVYTHLSETKQKSSYDKLTTYLSKWVF